MTHLYFVISFARLASSSHRRWDLPRQIFKFAFQTFPFYRTLFNGQKFPILMTKKKKSIFAVSASTLKSSMGFSLKYWVST